ncbi:MAG: MBL fold metallo-hydrolase [Bacteroidia bacterium]|nr:MBL fold metallo-hydrolase [Bacteroidia bacterium]
MENKILFHKYASEGEVKIYESVSNFNSASRPRKTVNTILMGTWVGVLEEKGLWYKVSTVGTDGWLLKSEVSDEMGLKVFFVDVGQGDGVLIEFGGKKMLIDAGQNSNIKNYLTNWQYAYFLDHNEKVYIDYVFITHFDSDHYNGISEIVNDNRFTFGTIFHAGIGKFKKKSKGNDNGYKTSLGHVQNGVLETTFSSISELEALKFKQSGFEKFQFSVSEAISQGRITEFARATHQTPPLMFNSGGKTLEMQFLGPVMEGQGYKYFKDESHTVNGHSLVIKLKYGDLSILFSGDLNEVSQDYLLKKYKNNSPFESHVMKAPHHGSSEQSLEFLKKVNPFVTVISSGDNEGHSHPRADALGAFGKYSRGEKPLIFSTELARSLNGKSVLFGMINLRSDGNRIFMAQMKETKPANDPWDGYSVPI